jgi:hypothetical protein
VDSNANVSVAVLIAAASVLPRVIGPKKCGKHGVGEIIRELRAELPGNGVGPYVVARREAVQLLESHCRQCGRCKMGQR